MSSKTIQLLGSFGFLLLHLAACGDQTPSTEGELAPGAGTNGDDAELETGNGDVVTTRQAQVAAVPLPGASITKWATRLVEPPVYVPNVVGGVAEYEVTVSETTAQMLPSDQPPTRVLAYGGLAQREDEPTPFNYVGSPGATFEVKRGQPVRVRYVNAITTPHLFPVPELEHQAKPTIPPGQTFVPIPHVTHLHGLEVASSSDGHPEAWFTADGQTGPGFNAVYDYPNSQPATTLWYHDHTLGYTRLNVYAGLAGMYLVRDDADPIENPASGERVLPDAAHEIPLVIQDKSFNDDGSLRYADNFVPAFFGDTNVVNGTVWPEMNVERAKYRFRIVNASNHRFYRFGLSSGENLTVIGSDGGYLQAAASVPSLLMAPGERADVLVDFTNAAAGPVVLTNSVGQLGTGNPEAQMAEVVRFVVPPDAPQPPPLAPLPESLNTIPALTVDPGIPRRTLTLNAQGTANFLDGQSFHAAVSELPRVGSTEEWDLVNVTPFNHSIHLHLIQFQIVGRQTINTTAYNQRWRAENGTTLPLSAPTQSFPVDDFLTGTMNAPAAPEAGWKDTILVPNGGVTRIRVRWAPQENEQTPEPGLNLFPFDPTNPEDPGYIWHCHLLEHEDHDMMRPIRVED